MADFIKREDVLAKIDKFAKLNAARGFPMGIFDIEMMRVNIAKIPAEDVVKIVRCKDCKHFNLHERKCESNEVHYDNEGGADYSIYFDVDDFCCFGERKGQDNG